MKIRNPNGGVDRRVLLRLELLNEGETIGTGAVGPVKVEESDSVTRTSDFNVPSPSLHTDPATKLRITLSL
jgi:hypothetical protein